MKPWMLEAAIVAASVAVWLGVYGLMLLITRPHHVDPAPAGQDLGPEPPAVVSLLANGWEITEDAVESTLLDLAARKYFEFRQPANDPRQTTIHVTPRSDALLADLTPYELSVYRRVTGLAQNGLVPLTALTFRDDSQSKSWWKAVRGTIVDDARRRGLSQRRFNGAVVGVLTLAAAVAAIGIAVAVYHYAKRSPSSSSDDSPLGTGLSVGFFSFVVLGAIGGRNIGERDTPQGREVAARWLGVKQWLRGNDGFTDLPPAAVTVWDRYLGYGAALGTTRVASAVIDMGMGNRRRVWSSFGGTWHRVKVSYPRFWPRYGHPWGKLLFRAILAGIIGTALVRLWERGLTNLSTVDFVHGQVYNTVSGLAAPIGYGIGVVLLAYAGYAVIRIVFDAALPKLITGQVLWLRVWRSSGGGEDSPAVPWLYYAALDDGSSDKTRAWGLPADLERGVNTGDTVAVTVRRWSRRVVALDIKQRGASGYTASAVGIPTPPPALRSDAAGGSGNLAFTGLAGLLGGGSITGSTLLTADEVSHALGMRVALRPTPAGPITMTSFTTDPGRKTVLMMQVMQGGLVEALWRRRRGRGQPVPGVGDEAWADGHRCVARTGGTFVSLVLAGPAKRSPAALPVLLGQAVARLPRQSTPAD